MLGTKPQRSNVHNSFEFEFGFRNSEKSPHLDASHATLHSMADSPWGYRDPVNQVEAGSWKEDEHGHLKTPEGEVGVTGFLALP
jgi:hypothetical protein